MFSNCDSIGSVVGADPTLTGAQTWLEMKKDLKDAAGITLKSIEDNLVDRIWYNKPESTVRFITCSASAGQELLRVVVVLVLVVETRIKRAIRSHFIIRFIK